MNQEPELVQCKKCGNVREPFLIGCPNCGEVETIKPQPEKDFKVNIRVTLESIKHGAKWFKDNLEDEQKKYFKERIPSGEHWSFYVGIILANRIAFEWIRYKLNYEDYSDPISVTNSRVLYIMSYMSEAKQNLFCAMLNRTNLMGETDAKDNIQGEDRESDDRLPG